MSRASAQGYGMSLWTAFFVAIAIIGHQARAQESVAKEPMTYKLWRDQQIVEAQNQLARVSNRLLLYRSGRLSQEELGLDLSAENDQKAALELRSAPRLAKKLSRQDIIGRLEMAVSRAQKSVELAQELSLEDYAMGYLTQFQGQPGAMALLVERMSKEEIAEILRILARSSAQSLTGISTGSSVSASRSTAAGLIPTAL